MPQATSTCLFQKLGGRPAVEAVVKEFYKRVLADAQLAGFFKNTDMEFQVQQQINFFSMALGGPNEYNGRNMKDAHNDLGITETHFDKVAGHLVDALKWAGVGQEDIDAVVGLVAPLKNDIVTC